MANQERFGVVFDTQGFKEAERSIKGLDKTYQKVLSDAEKANEELTKTTQEESKKRELTLKRAYRELGVTSTKSLEQQKRQAKDAYKAIRESGVASARDIEKAQDSLNRSLKRIDEQLGKVEKTSRRAGEGFTIFKGAVASFAGRAAYGAMNRINNAAGNLWQNILRAGQTTEGLRAQLLTLTGTQEEVDKVYSRLLDFAKTTTFQIPEVVEAYIKLANRGIAPTNEELRKMGDLAASQGKPLIQLVEAILDATTGQNERLKEFGINASKSGETVEFTFKGVSKQVEFTEDAIRDAILAMGEAEGVTGGLERAAEGVQGGFSNVEDVLDQVYSKIFDAISPALKAASDITIELSEGVLENNNLFEALNQQALEFTEYLQQNPELIQAAKKAIETGLKVAMEVVVELAQKLLETLKENPDAIANIIKSVESLAKAGKFFADIVLTAVEGWEKIFDLVNRIFTALNQPIPLPNWWPQQTYGPAGGAPNLNNGIGFNTQPSNTANSKQRALVQAANELGIQPLDLAAVISFETAGTFSPSIDNGLGYRGLIQFSPENQRTYRPNFGNFEDQMLNAVVPYLKDRGVKPGMGIKELYLAILTGYATRRGKTAGNPDALDDFGTSVNNALSDPKKLGFGGEHYVSAKKFLDGAYVRDVQQAAVAGAAAASGAPLPPIPPPPSVTQGTLPPPPSTQQLPIDFGNAFNKTFGTRSISGFVSDQERYKAEAQVLAKALGNMFASQDAERAEIFDGQRRSIQERVEKEKRLYKEYGERLLQVLEQNEQERVAKVEEYESYQTRAVQQQTEARRLIIENDFDLREQRILQQGGFGQQSALRQLALDRESFRTAGVRRGINDNFVLAPEERDRLLAQEEQQSQFNIANINNQFETLDNTIRQVTQGSLTSFFDTFIQGGDAVSALLSSITNALTNIASNLISTGLSSVLGTSGLGFAGAFASGGLVPGSGIRDNVLAALTPGEFVIRKDVANQIGIHKLQALNAGTSNVNISHNYYGGDSDTFRLTQAQRDRHSMMDANRIKSGFG